MISHALLEFLSRFANDIPLDDLNFIQSKIVKKEFKKKEIVLEHGKVENYIYFQEKGVVRYFFSKDDKDITVKIVFENDFMGSYVSFLTREPSKISIEALTDTVMWCISYDNLQELFKKTTCGNYIGRLANEWFFIQKFNRELSFLTDSAEQKYIDILKNNKHLIQYIPLKYLASYIGITPQALSRIRKRIS